jgi:hypothetical protein
MGGQEGEDGSDEAAGGFAIVDEIEGVRNWQPAPR